MKVEEYTKITEYDVFKDKKMYTLCVSISVLLSALIFFLIFTEYGSILYNESGLSTLVSYFMYHIENKTIYASFYLGLIGGLFFLTFPLEAVFIGLVGESIIGSITGIILGIAVSYTINYAIGYSLSSITRRLVGPQKFFKLKTSLNKYGAVLILILNIIPMVGQSLTALLGVIRYNKTRLITYTLIAQLIKYPLLTLFTL